MPSVATEFGVSVRSVGLRDIILPGEMKQILNQVIEAEKQAQANLIRRREETAAARSQANTAKLLAENPGAGSRMKELESLAGDPRRHQGDLRPRPAAISSRRCAA
jgi:regulator of protease activity HflC (stomatin/prohibitin superfamily)